MNKAKPFCISKWEVWEAYKRVKANRGAAGVDGQSITKFEEDLKNNLFKIWNRMSSGSYFPPPVRRVDIPKDNEGTRPLGIPTVADRIAMTVAKRYLEPILEEHFHPDSYGYRPEKSAIEAVAVARQRCWRYDWVLDLDIKGFFDSIDHDLLLRAVRKQTDCKWVLLYIERWLKASVQLEDGRLIHREKGTTSSGESSVPSLRISFCIMRSISGCRDSILRSLLSVMLMMGFAIVRVKPRLKVFGRRLSSGLLNADWNFIGRRRELSTARMIGGERTTLSKSSISWDIRFGPGERRTLRVGSLSVSFRPSAMKRQSQCGRR